MVLVTSTVWNTDTCGALNALETIASAVRKRTAEAMVSSAFSAPHVSVFHTVDVTKTMHLVERLREDREFADVRVTPLLIAAKALVLAVRRHQGLGGDQQRGHPDVGELAVLARPFDQVHGLQRVQRPARVG